MVVVVGENVGSDELISSIPFPGDQRYVIAPFGLRVIGVPGQVVVSSTKEIFNSSATVTVTVSYETQPAMEVTVNTYSMDAVGVQTGIAV